MKKLYSCAYGASKSGFISVTSGFSTCAVVAETESAARQIALNAAMEKFRPVDGYTNHEVDLIEVLSSMIEQVAHQ